MMSNEGELVDNDRGLVDSEGGLVDRLVDSEGGLVDRLVDSEGGLVDSDGGELVDSETGKHRRTKRVQLGQHWHCSKGNVG